MKLHLVHGSPNCRKPLTVIHHLKLDVEMHPMNFLAGDLGTPEYMALNPNGMVPCLEDGDFKLWESNAIMQYLADSVPDNNLFPADRRARADIDRWQCWELAHFNRATSAIVWENFVKGYFKIGEPDQAIINTATQDLHRFAPVLNKQVSTQPFVCGNHATLADYSIGCMLMYIEAGKLPLDDYKNIQAWFQRVQQLPGWAASAPPAA